MMVSDVVRVLRAFKFSLHSEKQLQAEIYDALHQSGYTFTRECCLDHNNCIDFYRDGVGIEVKLKGSAKNILKQCERYCQFKDIEILILVTNRSMGFPKEINGVPCYVVKLGEGWL